MSNNFSNEDEQLEKISLWWNSYKLIILASVVFIISSILGWDYLKEKSSKQSIAAAQEYEKYLSIYMQNDSNMDVNLEERALRIKADYSGYGYADMSALHLAKQYFLTGKILEAENELRWVIKRSSGFVMNKPSPLLIIARIRLSRLLLSQERYQDVIDLIDQNQELNSELHELKGDALKELNRYEEAKFSYLEALNSNQSKLLKNLILMKIANIEGARE